MGTGTDIAARTTGDGLRWAALSAIVLAVLAVDQALKESVRSNFDPGEGTHLFGPYSIHYVQNFGVAGGGLEARRALPLAVLAMMAVLRLCRLLAHCSHARVSLLIGFDLLIGRGLGSLVDRARFGFVTDFILAERVQHRRHRDLLERHHRARWVGGLRAAHADASTHEQRRMGRR